MTLIEYLIYRFSCFYRKNLGGGDLSISYGIALLLGIWITHLYTILAMFPDEHYNPFLFTAIACVYVMVKWTAKYDTFQEKGRWEAQWGNEPKRKKVLHGWLIVIYMILSFVSLFVVVYIHHNLGIGLF